MLDWVNESKIWYIQDTKLVTVILSVHNFTFLLLAKIFEIVKIDVKVQTLEWTCK